MQLDRINESLFLLINASDQASGIAMAAAQFAAKWLIVPPLLVMGGLWIWGTPLKRGALLAVSVAVLLGIATNQIIGEVWFNPRPFMLGIGRTLIPHAPDASFPSDHATLLWSLGFGLIAIRSWRIWGWVFVVIGLLVSWARVYLGLHFPLDVAGSLAVSLIAVTIACGFRPLIERRLVPSAESVYEFLLQRLRLPPAIFPRRSG